MNVFNTYSVSQRASRLAGNIKNSPLVLTGGRTINSEDVVKLRNIVIMVVDNNDPLEENIPSVGAPVTEGGLCDWQVWGYDGINPWKVANQHCCGTKIPSVMPSIVTNLTL